MGREAIPGDAEDVRDTVAVIGTPDTRRNPTLYKPEMPGREPL